LIIQIYPDIREHPYWGHGFDLSVLRDVIGHVTIGFCIAHFPLVVLWKQASICNGFGDIQW